MPHPSHRPMQRITSWAAWVALRLSLLLITPSVAQAHSFGQTFTLPVPFEMVAWASAATLVLTFLLMVLKASFSQGELVPLRILPDYQFEDHSRRSASSVVLAALSLLIFALAIASGLLGTQRRSDNFNMTYFWIIWMLGVAYLSGLTGRFWPVINPFLAFCQLLESLRKLYHQGSWKPQPIMALPDSLLHLLALLWMFVFAGYELFGHSKPMDLSLFLLAYLVYTVVGSWLVGTQVFHQKACFFTLYFELLARCGASLRNMLGRRASAQPNLLTPLHNAVPALFIVALFSTTALDGLLDTEYWYRTIWPQFVQGYCTLFRPELLQHVSNPLLMAQEFGDSFRSFEKWMLLALPLLSVLVFLLTLQITQWLTHSRLPLLHLAQAFAPTLIPIVLAYSFSHYFTLLLTQGVQVLHLLSDPMGRGWNLVGTLNLWRAPILLDAQLIWSIQVGSILIGHVFSTVQSHNMAFKLFLDRRQANLSQLPMLGLMILLTWFGLWVLSQPLQMGV